MIRPLFTFIAVVAVAALTLLTNRLSWEAQGEPAGFSATQNAELLRLTGSTARLAGEDFVRQPIAYSQAIYAAAQDKDRPGAVVLVRDDDPATAMASTRLQHFPINAPMLFVTDEGTVLPEATSAELERLGPEGVMMDHNNQVYLLGNIAPALADEIRGMGFKVRQIAADSPIAFSEKVDEFLAVLESDHAKSVLIAHIDALPYAYGGSNWNAHMGQAWAFVTDEGIPAETRRILERRKVGPPFIYVFAPPDIVPQSVMEEFSVYGHVQRIPGATPQEMAVRWAGFKDVGGVYGWWYGKYLRNVGWGYAEPGHNVLIANPNDWRTSVPSGVLSHMGKHAMLILTNDDGTLPEAATSYFEILQPTLTHPSQQLFTFAWILGQDVPIATQRAVDDAIGVQGLR